MIVTKIDSQFGNFKKISSKIFIATFLRTIDDNFKDMVRIVIIIRKLLISRDCKNVGKSSARMNLDIVTSSDLGHN